MVAIFGVKIGTLVLNNMPSLYTFMPYSTPYPKCLSHAYGKEWVVYPWCVQSEVIQYTRLSRPSQSKGRPCRWQQGPMAPFLEDSSLGRIGPVFNVILDEWHANNGARVLIITNYS